nr:MAG TPA: hypothetical protein [Microviridae sp.]
MISSLPFFLLTRVRDKTGQATIIDCLTSSFSYELRISI